MIKHRDRFLLSLLFATLFIMVHGYQFNNGDQEEHLPYVYKLIDSSLYQNDYLVPLQTTQFTVRYYFAHLVKAGSYLIPIPALVFLIYFFCLATIGWVVSEVAEKISKKQLVGTISPLFIIFFNNYTVGGNSIIDVQLTCTIISVALGTLAFRSFSKGNMTHASAWCGLASLFQLLAGLQLFLLLAVSTFLIVNKNRWMNCFKHVLTYLFIAGWMLFPLLQSQFSSSSLVENEKYFNILFFFRTSHHYNPFCFPLMDYVKTIAWWLIILISVQFGLKKQQLQNYSIFIFITTAGCVFYFVGFSLMNIPTIAKMQWFKATIWPTLFGCIPVSIFLVEKIKFHLHENYLKFWRWCAAICMIIGWGVLANSVWLPTDRMKYRYKLGNYPQKDLEKMHLWIATHTAREAVFLSFPDDESFLCEAKRSMPVGYKAVIHHPDFLLPWYEQMKNVYGVELNDDHCRKIQAEAKVKYAQRPDEMIRSNIKIDFRLWDLTEIDSTKIEWNQLIHREGAILLLPFSKKGE